MESMKSVRKAETGNPGRYDSFSFSLNELS